MISSTQDVSKWSLHIKKQVIRVLRIFLIVFIVTILVAGCATGRLRPNIKKADDEDENILADMAAAINEALVDNDIEKIELIIWEKDSPQAYSSVLCLSNFNRYLDDSQYGYLYYLHIHGNDGNEDSSYNQPSSYHALEGIAYLHVIENVNKSAEEEGIDWYEVFPDMKGYEVYQYEDGELTNIIWKW